MIIITSTIILVLLIFSIILIVAGITSGENINIGMGIGGFIVVLFILLYTIEAEDSKETLSNYKKIMVESKIAEYNSNGEFIIIKESDRK